MYDSGHFDQRDMITYENKAAGDKTWDRTKAYFEKLVTDQETYAENQGDTAKRARYESAAQAKEQAQAEEGDQLREYLEMLAAGTTTQEKQLESMKEMQTNGMHQIEATQKGMLEFAAGVQSQLKAKDDQMAALTKQMAEMAKAMQTLTKALATKQGGTPHSKIRPTESANHRNAEALRMENAHIAMISGTINMPINFVGNLMKMQQANPGDGSRANDMDRGHG